MKNAAMNVRERVSYKPTECTCRCDVGRIGKLVDGTDLMTTILSYCAGKMVESTLHLHTRL
jgi:hypothetical protein